MKTTSKYLLDNFGSVKDDNKEESIRMKLFSKSNQSYIYTLLVGYFIFRGESVN